MGARLDSTFLEPALMPEALPVEASTEGQDDKQVLLLEGDPAFEEALGAYLYEFGYSVTKVRTAADAVRMALERDFTAILCDMMLPALSGEMFFRAFERVDPQIGRRFVFLIGRSDPATQELIATVGGRTLKKPFRMVELLDLIEAQEPVSESEPEPAPESEPKPEAAPEHEELVEEPLEEATSSDGIALRKSRLRPKHSPRDQAERAKQGCDRPASPTVAASTGNSRKALSEPEQEPSGPSRTRRIALAAGICLCLAAGFHLWTKSLREEIAATEAEIIKLKSESASLTSVLPEAEKKRLQIEEYLKLPERLASERSAQGWTPLLQVIFEKSGRQTDIRQVRAHGMPSDSRACELQLEGFSTGSSPRKIADRFRQELHTGLTSEFPGPVSVRFDRLEDSPHIAEGAIAPMATFAMTAVIGIEMP